MTKYACGIVCKAPGRAAFTLIELLVVVGIIAVLMGLLIPQLSAAREQSRTMVCASNLKAYSQLVYAYAQDFEDQVVPIQILMRGAGGLGPTDYYAAPEVLQMAGYSSMPTTSSPTGFAGGKSIFICPNTRTDSTRAGAPSAPLPTRICDDSLQACHMGTLYTSDGHGGYLSSYLNSSYITVSSSGDSRAIFPFTMWSATAQNAVTLGSPARLQKIAAIEQPYRMAFLLDGTCWTNMFNADSRISFRHGNMTACNVAFADGHTETIDSNRNSAACGKIMPIPNHADFANFGSDPNPASSLLWHNP